jgi:SAM-dependent methyltransferase
MGKRGLELYSEMMWKPFFDEAFADIVSETILDAGCGDARYTHFLVDSNDYHGLDIKKTEFTTEIGSVENMPYKDKTFSEIICLGVLDYTDPEKTLREFNRVLKDKGIIRVMVPNNKNPYHIVSANFGIKGKRRYGKDEIMDLIEKNGFLIAFCLVRGFSFYVPFKWLQERFIPFWMAVEDRLGAKYGMNIYIEATKCKDIH